MINIVLTATSGEDKPAQAVPPWTDANNHQAAYDLPVCGRMSNYPLIVYVSHVPEPILPREFAAQMSQWLKTQVVIIKLNEVKPKKSHVLRIKQCSLTL